MVIKLVEVKLRADFELKIDIQMLLSHKKKLNKIIIDHFLKLPLI